jgi:hypothetical protein
MLVVALGVAVGAYEDPPPPPGPPHAFLMDEPFEGHPGGIVKGQPFSAQTVTEMTQTLADGNRIVQRTEGAVYRDGEGRTRRENTFTGMGPMPFGPAMKGRQVITIDDVVAGVQYALDPGDKTVRELPRWNHRRGGDGPPKQPGAPATRMPERTGDQTPVRESLGTKAIEGLDAEGTRMTVTIPAGQIGNEAPIVVVSERWVSKDLQVPVLTRFSDPRMGERVHRLTSITRGEPSPQLFVVPSDYTKAAAPERPMRQKRTPQ